MNETMDASASGKGSAWALDLDAGLARHRDGFELKFETRGTSVVDVLPIRVPEGMNAVLTCNRIRQALDLVEAQLRGEGFAEPHVVAPKRPAGEVKVVVRKKRTFDQP